MRRYKPGEIVVYAKQKWSSRPGPRARQVVAAVTGEQYSYVVHKFWRVVSHRADGMLVLRTRTLKTHLVAADDPLLRRPTLWERLVWWHKFPAPGEDPLAGPATNRSQPRTG